MKTNASQSCKWVRKQETTTPLLRKEIKVIKVAKGDKGSKATISKGRATTVATVTISRREVKVAKRVERIRKVTRKITTMR